MKYDRIRSRATTTKFGIHSTKKRKHSDAFHSYAGTIGGGIGGFVGGSFGHPMAGEIVGSYIGSSTSKYLSSKDMKVDTGANISRESGNTTRGPAIKRVKKGKPEVGTKKVHITRDFRKKVNQVLESSTIQGSAREVSYGPIPLPNNQNQQVAAPIADFDYSKWCFDPENWGHLIGVMFSKKVYSQTSQPWTTMELGTGALAGTANSFNNSMNLKVHIINSFEKRIIKNNTARTLSISVYVCSPKKTDFKADTNVPAIGAPGAVVATPSGMVDPVNHWANCLFDEFRNGVNINDVKYSLLYEIPTRCEAWRKSWDYELVKVVLEPGQTYEHFIQGPQHFDLNYASLFQNGAYLGIQKFMRYCFYIVHLDLLGMTGGPYTGRPAPQFNQSESGFGLKCERVKYVDFKMPELSGFLAPALYPAGSAVQLGYRKNTWFHQVNSVVLGTNIIKEDEENPIQNVAAGI